MRTPGNTQLANFTCLIPRVAVDGPQVLKSRASLYGHGLLGSASEITAGNIKSMANEHNFVFCATDWSGMSNADIPEHRRDARRSLELPGAPRPGAAGLPELHVPGPR